MIRANPAKLTRSTAHLMPPNALAWTLALAYWRLCRRREEQMELKLEAK